MAPRRDRIEWPWFILGCVLLVSALVAFFWGFSLSNLTNDQHFLLMWLLPLTSGFACGCFAGSLKVSGPLGSLAVAATGGFAIWFLSYYLLPNIPESPQAPLEKIVVTMDSPLQTYAETSDGRTNSDEIYDALKDIKPLKVIKENTSLHWNRHEVIRTLNPSLIVIHVSAFDNKTAPAESEEDLRKFVRYMTNTQTAFLFYSRGLAYEPGETASATKERQAAEYISRSIGAPLERTHVFMFPPGSRFDFRDAAVKDHLIEKVMDILHI